MRRTALACSLFVALAPQMRIAGVSAAGLSPQPHRAVYDLALERASSATIVAADGRLVMEWSADCEGHVLNQRILTRLVDTEGERAVNDYQVTSWESQDGTRFRFNSRNELNGELVDEVAGVAELEEPGGAGKVTFTKPEPSTLMLPPGVVFPTEHTFAVIRAARTGKRFVEIPLFDGSSADALFTTFSAIGDAEADPPEAKRHAALREIRAWPVQLAYFRIPGEPERRDQTPEFETGMRLFENGVTGDIVLDYGGFKLGGVLSRLEPLPRPAC